MTQDRLGTSHGNTVKTALKDFQNREEFVPISDPQHTAVHFKNLASRTHIEPPETTRPPGISNKSSLLILKDIQDMFLLVLKYLEKAISKLQVN